MPLRILVLLAIGLLSCGFQAEAATRRLLDYAPAPVGNPLKGLVPYTDAANIEFPHSMEFSYLPLSGLVIERDRYDWAILDDLLDHCEARGHQAVFRVYLEFPGRQDGMPAFLLREGLLIHKYAESSKNRPTESHTPDYNDPKLRSVLTDFIAALGKRYDGDPRVGFITAGLLGKWGEWHTFPKEELFASKEVQTEVMDAYEAAFRTTPILLRYPANSADRIHSPNVSRRFGYHDDSFAWATLDTGRKDDNWFYMAALTAAGPQAANQWKTQPIGGEIRPEAWGQVFDEQPTRSGVQNFRRCVEATHVTWLMDSGMFRKTQRPERRRRAENEVRRMGYEFHIPAVTIDSKTSGELSVMVELENRGVAPFYYDWPVEYALFADGKVERSWKGTGKLSQLLPGAPVREWTEVLNVRGAMPGVYQLALRVANPLPSGNPVRFANKSQDASATGWLSLGDVQVP